MSEMVQKAYLVDIYPFTPGLVRKVLVTETHVFIPTSGWINRGFIEENYTLHVLPKKFEKPGHWNDAEWWEENWKLPCWSWCYMYEMPRFVASRIVDGFVFAA